MEQIQNSIEIERTLKNGMQTAGSAPVAPGAASSPASPAAGPGR